MLFLRTIETEHTQEEESAMLKAMIVDDDINVIDCLSALIPWEKIGCELVATALNGEIGYEMAVKHSPDIIICDIVMPVMDGTDLCRRVHETMSDIAFIFLSAYEDFATAQLALKYHVRDYLLKPLTRSKLNYLTDLIEKICTQRAKNTFYMRILHDFDTEQRINQALAANDVTYFEQLFQQLTTDITSANLDIAHIRDVTYRLLNLLFTHLRRLGQDCAQDRANIFQQLESLKFKMDLVFFTSECFFQHISTSSKPRTIYYKALLKQVAAYIDENFADPDLSALSVATHFNYSSDYLGRLFPQYYGRSVSSYLSEKRLSHAAALLSGTSMPVSDVAVASGYLNASYFARVFRKRFNASPGDYRASFSSLLKE